ncbi:hypothetical protein PVE_R1G2326 [Pseudomonas veronii 1YdBTEX2]|uniref:Uncharacterized protein n=1 Tax=Pseudomonas veronii 1YdBTEX2 TaxID=1295141 RepID=A0A1D3JW18_PSEVE|nr:hypothetical protein PVE_R1G2326 [Pseudomonas veronii 1YdBTEX2]
MPWRTRWLGSTPARSWPAYSITPRLTSARSARTSPEIALSVVLLPAPLAPSKATIAPLGTLSDTPATARIAPS